MARDRRLYARFAINMDEHPKILTLSDAAFRALFESTFYSRRQLTDGFIDARVAISKWGDDVAKELSSNDPVKPSWRIVDGGYQIHDFEEHQVTTADIQAKREAGRAGGLAKASKPVAGASKVLQQSASTTLAKTETETETYKRTSSSSPATPSMEFTEFWAAYPRKVGKQAAIKAYSKAMKLTDPQKILEGIQKIDVTEPQYIPHPATWLNAGRWDDEVIKPKETYSPWDQIGGNS